MWLNQVDFSVVNDLLKWNTKKKGDTEIIFKRKHIFYHFGVWTVEILKVSVLSL